MDDYRKFLRDFEEFRIRARHLFEERVSALYGGGPTSSGEWTPAVDVYETADRLVLVAELAAVQLEDVRIEVVGNILTVRGERPFERKGFSAEHCRRMEIGYGRFERSFTLPYPVRADGIEAVLRDGVLTVSLPREAAPPSRRISVGAG